MIDYRDNIRKALAGSGTGTKDVVLSGLSQVDSFLLVQMEIQRQSTRNIALFSAENPSAFGVNNYLSDKLVYWCARFKCRVELDERITPKKASCKRFLEFLFNPGVGDVDEALDVFGVVANHIIAKLKNLHSEARILEKPEFEGKKEASSSRSVLQNAILDGSEHSPHLRHLWAFQR